MTTLTLIFALPLLAAIALAFVPRNFAVIMRAVAVGVTFVTMLLGILMFWQFNGAIADASGYKFVSTIPWLGAESLTDISLSIFVGILVATYSTLFVAAPL